ncbi:hypothetical protein [Agromyces sp. NPDC058064]|uniref:hypothetical protein n=1 Tax=Agromyces sp. NPDC058064 TaxID=3346322 RepID=UPI0036DE08DB
MKIWVVAAMVTAATIAAVAAAYGVGTLVGMQVATSHDSPIGAGMPAPPVSRAGDVPDAVALREAGAMLGSYDLAGSAAVYCEPGEIALGGGRLGSGGGVTETDDGPIAGSDGATRRPIGWRIEVERVDADRSPRFFAAYVVCLAD